MFEYDLQWLVCLCLIRSQCEGPLEFTNKYGFAEALSYMYSTVLDCRVNCLQTLGKFRINAENIDFLASYFHYLQYGYNWSKNGLVFGW